jgi:hypothetical protein
MITKETHRIDWNKTAHVASVVVVALAKAAWWLAKHGWALVVATLAVFAKVFVAIVSVWASVPDSHDNSTDSDNVKPGEFGYRADGKFGYGIEYNRKNPF